MKCLLLALLCLPFQSFAQTSMLLKPRGFEITPEKLDWFDQYNRKLTFGRGAYKQIQLSGLDTESGDDCHSKGSKLVVVLKIDADSIYTYEKTEATRCKFLGGEYHESDVSSQVVRKAKLQGMVDLYNDLSRYAPVLILNDGQKIIFYSEQNYSHFDKSQSIFTIEKALETPLFLTLNQVEFFDSSSEKTSYESQKITSTGLDYDLSSLKMSLSKINFIGLQKSENRADQDLRSLIND